MFKKVAFQLALVLFVGLIIYSVLPGSIDFKNLVVAKYGNKSEPTNKPSVFAKKEKFKITEDTPLAEDVAQKFKNNPEEYLAFKYGWAIISIPKDAEWNYKRIPILSKIEKVDLQSRKVDIKIIKPAYTPAIGQTKTFDLNICTIKNTYFQVEEHTFTERMEYLEAIDTDMYILSFCADAKCNSFERLCKILM